jgi:hypothetical protein
MHIVCSKCCFLFFWDRQTYRQGGYRSPHHAYSVDTAQRRHESRTTSGVHACVIWLGACNNARRAENRKRDCKTLTRPNKKDTKSRRVKICNILVHAACSPPHFPVGNGGPSLYVCASLSVLQNSRPTELSLCSKYHGSSSEFSRIGAEFSKPPETLRACEGNRRISCIRERDRAPRTESDCDKFAD